MWSIRSHDYVDFRYKVLYLLINNYYNNYHPHNHHHHSHQHHQEQRQEWKRQHQASNHRRRDSRRIASRVPGTFSFFFFCTILMFVLPRSTRNRKKGPRDVTNVSWVTVFNFTTPANADHGARDKSQAPSSVSFFFFLHLFIALISI